MVLGLKVSQQSLDEEQNGSTWRLQELAEQSEECKWYYWILILTNGEFKESSTFTFLKFHSGCKVEHRLRGSDAEAGRPTPNFVILDKSPF